MCSRYHPSIVGELLATELLSEMLVSALLLVSVVLRQSVALFGPEQPVERPEFGLVEPELVAVVAIAEVHIAMCRLTVVARRSRSMQVE